MSHFRHEERDGMALLTVLLLVAVMAAVAVLILDDVRFSVRRSSNIEFQAELQGQAAIAEAAARQMLSQRVGTGSPFSIPAKGLSLPLDTDIGRVTTTVHDGQTCFNLNSLVMGQGEDLRARPEAADQFVELGIALGIARPLMINLASSLTDWMDSDQTVIASGGAEDAAYATGRTPYRTAGLVLSDVSELRAIKGVTPRLYDVLFPYVCALPEAQPARLNINALAADKAPLLVAISHGQLSLGNARAAIAARPPSGWSSADAFWASNELNTAVASDEMRRQTVISSRYFDIKINVEAGDGRAVRTALIHVSPEGEARTLFRRWTAAE